MDQLIEDTDAASCFLPHSNDAPVQPDELLNNLIGALRATIAHPDEQFQTLARRTLNQVRTIREAARQERATRHAELTTKRLALLIEQIALALGADPGKLRSRARPQHIAFQRQISVFLARRLTNASWPTIASAFGRDHSTCIWANQAIKRRMTDHAFERSLNAWSGGSLARPRRRREHDAPPDHYRRTSVLLRRL